ncbi:MAG: HAD hydrolase-like protein [Oligosphaeraceae bacterium]|nr:HAD hydrolase-like protein [Oligosphaeraceae bacterium]
MHKSIILFDLDGTLIDSLQDLTNAINYTRRCFSLLEHSVPDVKLFIGDGLLKLIQRAFADLPPQIDIQQPLQVYREYYLQHLLDHTCPYPGVLETLPLLAQQRLLGVVTNKPQQEAMQICTRLGLAEYFAVIIGGDTAANIKPHPAQLLLALQQTGAVREGSWMVGDHYTDLAAAAAARFRACFCAYGLGQKRQEYADLSINRFPELLQLL